MTTMISSKAVVKHTPIATTILLEGANVQQLWRMWTEHTAAGQSLTGWMCVGIALALWYNWYRVFTPEQLIAKYSTLVGITLNLAVVLTVVHFRY